MITDPFYDTGLLAAWMELADSPVFWEALGDLRGKAVLEVGVGTGRVARKALEHGCACLVGLDISEKTLARAARNLAAWPNIELVHGDMEAFRRENAFDAAYAVWAFFHIADQRRALENLVASLKPGCRLVLSLEKSNPVLDYGPRKIVQHPADPAQVAAWLRELGCMVAPAVEVYDTVTLGEEKKLFGVVVSAMRKG